MLPLTISLTQSKKSSTSGGANNDNAAAGDNNGNNSGTRSGSPTGTATSAASTPTATTGTQGSLITLDDGREVTYDNPYGGKWVWDPSNPFNNEAQAQSYTPPLNQNWTWGVNKIYGVNLGGWLNTEPFIVPALYEIYANGSNGQTAIDEYTLSQNMGDNLTAAMTEHYETFITEQDFIEMVSAGLNWIRLPIAHWAISTSSEEPYLERVSWTYVLKALGWARKYGMRVNLDLHTLPGSQNGWNHSGKIGTINWMNGAMGLANAQRALDYLRTLAQFVSQPEWAPVVQMFGFNEPNAGQIGQRAVGSFYHEMHDMVREITGFGEGRGPMLTIHDGFIGISSWYNFLPGADRVSLDQHPYMIFGDQPMASQSLAQVARQPCSIWASQTNQTSIQYGVNSAGEWSAAPNDCGLWVNSVGGGSRYDGTHADYIGKGVGSCDYWNDWTQWDQATKDNMLTLVSASMDALQNFFFWTWKIGNSTGPIPEPNPFWHYRLGLREGWVPKGEFAFATNVPELTHRPPNCRWYLCFVRRRWKPLRRYLLAGLHDWRTRSWNHRAIRLVFVPLASSFVHQCRRWTDDRLAAVHADRDSDYHARTGVYLSRVVRDVQCRQRLVQRRQHQAGVRAYR